MRVGVIGATGYVGGRLVPHLLEAGHEVRCLARTPDRLRDVEWRPSVEVVAADVLDRESLTAGFDGLDAVYYPPRGYVPVDLFGARHAWSITLLRGGKPSKDKLKVLIFELDENYLKRGAPLQLDYRNVAGGGFGGGPCLLFRPVGLRVEPGRRYLAEVSVDGGNSVAHRYVVEFCEPIELLAR